MLTNLQGLPWWMMGAALVGAAVLANFENGPTPRPSFLRWFKPATRVVCWASVVVQCIAGVDGFYFGVHGIWGGAIGFVAGLIVSFIGGLIGTMGGTGRRTKSEPSYELSILLLLALIVLLPWAMAVPSDDWRSRRRRVGRRRRR